MLKDILFVPSSPLTLHLWTRAFIRRRDRWRPGSNSAACEHFTKHPASAVLMQSDRSTPAVVQAGPYRLVGVSIAAVETCIWIPSLSLAIDAGKSPAGAVPMKYMAITHGHCDHVHGLPLHAATRALQNMQPATYFVPPAIASDIGLLVNAVARLERADLRARIVPLAAGDTPVDFGRRGWCLGAFETSHTVPSQGYIIYQRRRKLRPQFSGSTQDEIIRLKREGIDIQVDSLVPEIAFTGDTTLDAIQRSEDCQNARVLVTEMTFIDAERSAQSARALGHVHLDDVIANQHLFANNQHIVFSHFSARYSNSQIQEAIYKLPIDLRKKCSVLIKCPK